MRSSSTPQAHQTSIPLELPPAHGGLPVPLRVSYGGNRVGAAGLSWDIPVSYIFRDTTVAHHRPANLPDASIQARTQMYLTLDGERIDLVRNASDTAWIARRDKPQLEVRDLNNGVMLMYDG